MRETAIAVALAVSAMGCRGGGAPASVPEPAAVPFRMADLASASEFDVAVARLSLAASDYKMAMTFDRGDSLTEATRKIAPRLDAEVAAVDRALAGISHPADHQRAKALADAVRPWPGLLRAAREELMGADGGAGGRASSALALADDAVARALEDYRSFRAGWQIADAPSEVPSVIAFLQERRTLEAAEGEIGGSLRRALVPDAGTPQVDRVRAAAAKEVERARAAAMGVEGQRRASAEKWVDAQARAIEALLKIAAPTTAAEERGRQTLLYERAKVEVLTATAEYTRLTVPR